MAGLTRRSVMRAAVGAVAALVWPFGRSSSKAKAAEDCNQNLAFQINMEGESQREVCRYEETLMYTPDRDEFGAVVFRVTQIGHAFGRARYPLVKGPRIVPCGGLGHCYHEVVAGGDRRYKVSWQYEYVCDTELDANEISLIDGDWWEGETEG